jgi:hypothetical protein
MDALTKTELTAALNKNEQRIHKAVARLNTPLTDEEWQYVLAVILELRRVQKDLEDQLKALAE